MRPPTHRCRHIPWHVLMRRGLGLDVETCPRCRGDSPRKSVLGGPGKMRLVALVQEPENIARYRKQLLADGLLGASPTALTEDNISRLFAPLKSGE